MEGLIIRSAAASDLKAFLAVAAACPEAAQWPRLEIERLCVGEAAQPQAQVAEHHGAVVGFVVTRTAADEMEILNLAVVPERRRMGAGRALLGSTAEIARSAGARRIYLDVRESNRSAIALYSAAGFQCEGRRKNYYSAPVEAALLFARTV